MRNGQDGVTVVELAVSMGLASLVLAGATLGLFTSAEGTRLESADSTLDLKLRTVFERMVNDMRFAVESSVRDADLGTPLLVGETASSIEFQRMTGDGTAHPAALSETVRYEWIADPDERGRIVSRVGGIDAVVAGGISEVEYTILADRLRVRATAIQRRPGGVTAARTAEVFIALRNK